ncbi:MAG: helix-turn-helix domain-containing protein [Solirubrobacteraceae bacterium]
MSAQPAFSIVAPPELVDAIAEAVVAKLATAQPAATTDGYLCVAGAARFLAAPKSRVYDLVQLGRLTPLRDGRRLLFRRSDIVDYVESGGSE